MNPDNSTPITKARVEFCNRSDSEGPCREPTTSLSDEHWGSPVGRQGDRVTNEGLARHAAGCDFCIRRLLSCARLRGCDGAWNSLGDTSTAIAGNAMAAVNTITKTQEDRADATSSAAIHVFRIFKEKSDLLEKNNLANYSRTAAKRRLYTWKRRDNMDRGIAPTEDKRDRQKSGGVTASLEDFEDQDTLAAFAANATDPEQSALAGMTIKPLLTFLNLFPHVLIGQNQGNDRERKRGEKLVLLYGEWRDRKSYDPESEPNESEITRELQASGVSISQPTVNRGIPLIRDELRLILEKPTKLMAFKADLADDENFQAAIVAWAKDPELRAAAIAFFCDPPRADRKADAPDNINPETGDNDA